MVYETLDKSQFFWLTLVSEKVWNPCFNDLTESVIYRGTFQYTVTVLLFCDWHKLLSTAKLPLCTSGGTSGSANQSRKTIEFLIDFLSVMYRISIIFCVGLIFAEFATSLKSQKIDTVKNKPYYTSSLRILEIAKIGFSENLTQIQSGIFAKISWDEKFPICGILF